MRILFVLIFLLTSSLAFSQLNFEQEIQKHREEINLEFSDSTTSILPKEDLAEFHGLDFFDPNESFNLTVKFKKIKAGKLVGFATSTDRIAKYRPYGILKFKVNGEKCELTVYQPATPIKGYENHLFLPFKDLTNGATSYGGGRYLDLSTTMIKKKFKLDFNKCYNPYCAYSDRFSCPVPPTENHLNVEILAGVKGYKEH